MGLKLVTAPSVEPVTLAEAKAHVRATDTAEDALISALIVAARSFAEDFTGRAFVTQTWDWALDEFPLYLAELPKAPLQSVTSVSYIDTNGATQTLGASLYKVDALTDPGRMAPAYGEVWPSTRSEPNAVTVRFVAGYGLAAAVPQPIKQAMLLLVGQQYEHREVTEEGSWSRLPYAVDALLGLYRVIRWA